MEFKESFKILQPTIAHTTKPTTKRQEHALYDGLDRMFLKNFAAVALEPITYGNETMQPRPLVVRKRLFCDFSCPSHCGACCVRANLEYLPFEFYPKEAIQVPVTFNNKVYITYQDRQLDNETRWCRNLNMTDGRCGVYPDKNFPGKAEYPFSCDFNLMQVHNAHTRDKREAWELTTALFGRPWHMLKIDEQTKGAACEMLNITNSSIVGTRRRLARLKQWADYFEIKTRLPEIILWAQQDPYKIKEDLWFGL
jgi:hypothetical protein